MFVCLFVCLFAKNSKTTQHINLKLCMYIIHDNGREISYLKLTSKVALLFFLFIFFQIFHQKQTSVLIFKLNLNIQTQPGDVQCHDQTQADRLTVLKAVCTQSNSGQLYHASYSLTSSSIQADRMRKKRANVYILMHEVNLNISFIHLYHAMHILGKSQLTIYLSVVGGVKCPDNL